MLLIITDFKNTKKSEKVLTEVLNRYDADVSGWTEKDYGLNIFVKVETGPKSAGLEMDINASKDYSYEII